MKVAICGPPHSGKSVFLGGLTKNLPRNLYYLFRACPDGEGTWTYRGNGSERFRRKGQFTIEQVDWYCKKLKENSLAPLTIVDVGGRITEENRRILSEGGVDYAIILAAEIAHFQEWEDFCSECGVEVLVKVLSEYNSVEDDLSRMAVHHLERGEEVQDRPVIQKVAEMVLTIVPESIGTKGGLDMKETINISALAEKLGKELVERTLPNGRVVSQIVWEGSDLVSIARLLHNHSAGMADVVKVDGAAPAWLVTALVHECHPRSVALNSPDGFVPVGCNRPEGEGSGKNLTFKVENREDGWTILTVEMTDPSIPLSPDDLSEASPPYLEMGAKVILSGRMPNWLSASIAMAYHGTARAVALFQPGTGATVAWTHSTEVALGSVIN